MSVVQKSLSDEEGIKTPFAIMNDAVCQLHQKAKGGHSE
jgi:hypothetical protein